MSKFIDLVRVDYSINKNIKKSFMVVFLYRCANYLFLNSHKNFIQNIIYILFNVFYKLIVQIIFNVELPARVICGKGLSIIHGQGIVVNGNSIIGDFVTIKHNVTIGASLNFETNECK